MKSQPLYSRTRKRQLAKNLDEIKGIGWCEQNPEQFMDYLAKHGCRDPHAEGGVITPETRCTHMVIKSAMQSITMDSLHSPERLRLLTHRVVTAALLGELSGLTPIQVGKALKSLGLCSYHKRIKGKVQRVYHLRELCLALGVENELFD